MAQIPNPNPQTPIPNCKSPIPSVQFPLSNIPLLKFILFIHMLIRNQLNGTLYTLTCGCRLLSISLPIQIANQDQQIYHQSGTEASNHANDDFYSRNLVFTSFRRGGEGRGGEARGGEGMMPIRGYGFMAGYGREIFSAY